MLVEALWFAFQRVAVVIVMVMLVWWWQDGDVRLEWVGNVERVRSVITASVVVVKI